MNFDDALGVLGLDRAASWPEARAAYRIRIRAAHPDAGVDGTNEEAVRLNAAFHVVERVLRRGEPAPPAPPPPVTSTPSPTTRDPAHHGPPVEVVLVDDDSLALEAPHEEVFFRLAAAIDDIGDVTYADPDAGYLEALVANGAGQLVVSLQGRAHATEAFFTLEPIGAAPVPPIDHLVRDLAWRVRAGRGV